MKDSKDNWNVDWSLALAKAASKDSKVDYSLANLKPESIASSRYNPNIEPWYGYGIEFDDWFNSLEVPRYIPKRLIKNLMSKAWDAALLAHRKKLLEMATPHAKARQEEP